MITKTINGREYRLRDFLTAKGMRALSKDDDGFAYAIVYEMLLNDAGAKYADVDSALDTIAAADFPELMQACMAASGLNTEIESESEGDSDPLLSSTDSPTA